MLTCGRVNVKCQGARSLMLLHNFTCHSTIPKQKGVYVCVRLCVDKWLCVEIKADVLLDMGWFYTRVQVKIRYDNKRYIPVTCHTYPAPSCVSCPMPILRCCTRTCVCVCVCELSVPGDPKLHQSRQTSRMGQGHSAACRCAVNWFVQASGWCAW